MLLTAQVHAAWLRFACAHHTADKRRPGVSCTAHVARMCAMHVAVRPTACNGYTSVYHTHAMRVTARTTACDACERGGQHADGLHACVPRRATHVNAAGSMQMACMHAPRLQVAHTRAAPAGGAAPAR
jgi:hypothetical protein